MRLIFSRHALERMFQRAIAPADVWAIVHAGDAIEEYPDDLPFPSRLMLGRVGDRPFHVVVAVDNAAGVAHVVTAYEPNLAQWQRGFRVRQEQ